MFPIFIFHLSPPPRVTKQTRKRHEKGMVRARFFRPPKSQPPSPTALAPPEKVCFSAARRICQTNPPLHRFLPSVPVCLCTWPMRPGASPVCLLQLCQTNPPLASPLHVSCLHVSRLQSRPNQTNPNPQSEIRNPQSRLR